MLRQLSKQIEAGIFGLFTADAVGVPAEFRSRGQLARDPVTDMCGGGTYGLPAGSWSDDSSMTLCLLVSMQQRGAVEPEDIMARFADWRFSGDYTPFGSCFDCGNTCGRAIARFRTGTPPEQCGDTGVRNNGNGSLMRILPLVYPLYDAYGRDLTAHGEAMELIRTVSALTHGHPIAVSACGIYLCIAANLLDGMGAEEAMQTGVTEALAFYREQPAFSSLDGTWDRIASIADLRALPEHEINSSGYVVDTLEAALWCLLNTADYRSCVLKAVNLGSDTDTTAAVAGGLAGLIYGTEGIPAAWLDALQRRDFIADCCAAFAESDVRVR